MAACYAKYEQKPIFEKLGVFQVKEIELSNFWQKKQNYRSNLYRFYTLSFDFSVTHAGQPKPFSVEDQFRLTYK